MKKNYFNRIFYRVNKLKKNLLGKCYRYDVIKNPKIYMTILAKNEIDVIEKNLIFHKSMGIDGFIVTDNNSTDGTKEVFEKYKKKGWIKEIIYELSDDYQQIKWVDRMIKIAKKYGADWIINADADEFWYFNNENAKEVLGKKMVNKLEVYYRNMIPIDEELFYKNTLKIKKSSKELQKFKLSKFSLYINPSVKVIHRSVGYKNIYMGNHDVDMIREKKEISKDIEIFHYGIRSLKHFKEKMINGGAAVEKNLKLGKDVAIHWRYFYELQKNGKINWEEEYNKVTGINNLKEFIESNAIEEDSRIKEFFEKMEKLKNENINNR